MPGFVADDYRCHKAAFVTAYLLLWSCRTMDSFRLHGPLLATISSAHPKILQAQAQVPPSHLG